MPTLRNAYVIIAHTMNVQVSIQQPHTCITLCDMLMWIGKEPIAKEGGLTKTKLALNTPGCTYL